MLKQVKKRKEKKNTLTPKKKKKCKIPGLSRFLAATTTCTHIANQTTSLLPLNTHKVFPCSLLLLLPPINLKGPLQSIKDLLLPSMKDPRCTIRACSTKDLLLPNTKDPRCIIRACSTKDLLPNVKDLLLLPLHLTTKDLPCTLKEDLPLLLIHLTTQDLPCTLKEDLPLLLPLHLTTKDLPCTLKEEPLHTKDQNLLPRLLSPDSQTGILKKQKLHQKKKIRLISRDHHQTEKKCNSDQVNSKEKKKKK